MYQYIYIYVSIYIYIYTYILIYILIHIYIHVTRTVLNDMGSLPGIIPQTTGSCVWFTLLLDVAPTACGNITRYTDYINYVYIHIHIHRHVFIYTHYIEVIIHQVLTGMHL